MQDAYWRNLHYACLVGPVGFVMSFFKSPGNKATYWGPENAKIFLILYGITGYFFATKMARLIILMGPIASALSGIALAALFKWCLKQLTALVVPEDDSEPTSTESSSKDSEAKGGKGAKAKKGPKVKAVGLSDNLESLTTAYNTYYRSEEGKRIRTAAALVALLLVFFFSATFFSYRCVEQRVCVFQSNREALSIRQCEQKAKHENIWRPHPGLIPCWACSMSSQPLLRQDGVQPQLGLQGQPPQRGDCHRR